MPGRRDEVGIPNGDESANLLTLITPLNAEEAEAFAANQDKVGTALLQAIRDAG